MSLNAIINHLSMTDEEIEKAARQYLKPRFTNDACRCMLLPWDKVEEYCIKTLADFAKQCISKQWISVDERLPEEKKAVLCYMPDMKDSYADKDMYFDMVILLEGEFINLDAEVIHPSHWMPIPIPPLNPEKE